MLLTIHQNCERINQAIRQDQYIIIMIDGKLYPVNEVVYNDQNILVYYFDKYYPSGCLNITSDSTIFQNMVDQVLFSWDTKSRHRKTLASV